MISNKVLNCFTAYDVRGKIGEGLNEDIAYRIGRATVQLLKAKAVVVGFDARATSSAFSSSVVRGICDSGADAIELGLAGTEEMYAAVIEFDVCAGIEITASHNPIDYNGMKIVKHGSQPLTVKEFNTIKCLTQENTFVEPQSLGLVLDKRHVARDSYIEKIMSFLDLSRLRPLKIVINSGNGAAGPTIEALNERLMQKGVNTNFFFMHHDPDPSFPNGIPNPLLEKNRSLTADAVVREKANFGVAFDGDFDRCFLFDHNGQFISGEYMMGLLAEIFLRKEKGAIVVHDPRVIWNIQDLVGKFNGVPIAAKTGHTFLKAAMRDNDAVYGGEMSAHHYFRDFAYCDSGMIPWLMIWQLLSETKRSLSDLILERTSLFPSSGELNFTVLNTSKSIQRVKNFYSSNANRIDELDGLSMSFKAWRFNLRKSNTEPLIRLNVETKGDHSLLASKTEELRNLIEENNFSTINA